MLCVCDFFVICDFVIFVCDFCDFKGGVRKKSVIYPLATAKLFLHFLVYIFLLLCHIGAK